jgi:Helicase HerA, central domain
VTTGSTHEWAFSPRPRRLRAGPAVEPSDPRAGAVRAGHAIAAEFELEWTTGPRAEVILRAADLTTERWIARLLAPTFEAGQWRPRDRAGPRESSVPARRFGHSTGGLLPLGCDGAPPWTDAVVRALGTFPAGLRTSWRFRAADRPTGSIDPGPGLEAQFQPPGFRLRNVTGPERDARDGESLARNAPRWGVQALVQSTDPAVTPTDLDRWAAVISTSSARTGRGQVIFRRPSLLRGSRPPLFLVSEPELLGILPSVETYFASDPPPPVRGGFRLPFGRSSDGNLASVDIDPGQGRHLIALGETGMGKSSLLVRLARAAAGRGNIVLFDPVGDTGREFLGSLPSRFARDVVWISPRSSPVSLDLLSALRGSGRSSMSVDRAVSDLVSALRRIRAVRYTDATFWGPRIEETVRATIRTGALIPGAGLEDLPKLLTTYPRRPIGIPEAARDAYDDLTARVRERPEEVEGSRRLLSEVTDRPALLSLLGDRGARFTVGEMFATGRITVVTGDAPAIGEDAARYLLAVYLALLWSERLGRESAPKTFVVLDEAQWFVHDSVAEMLRLGRREDLHVWMATQALDSLPENVRAAVQTNVADFLVFRGSPADARDLGRMTPRLDLDTIWSQPSGHAVALLGKGERVLVVRVDPPIPPDPVRLESRLALARESSARFLPAEPGEPTGAESDGASPPRSSPETSPGIQPILLALWSEVLEVQNGASARFYLNELRQAFDPDGEEVREVGRRLSEAGALARTDRDERGKYWEVGRIGFERLLGPGVDPKALDAAARRWKSRAPPSGASGAE